MMIELPGFVPPATGHQSSGIHRITSIPDVWRRYDPEKADRYEAAPEALPQPAALQQV